LGHDGRASRKPLTEKTATVGPSDAVVASAAASSTGYSVESVEVHRSSMFMLIRIFFSISYSGPSPIRKSRMAVLLSIGCPAAIIAVCSFLVRPK